MIFSSKKRITAAMVALTRSATNPNRGLCAGAFGTQSDIQCMGYDRLCALAAVLDTGDSYKAVAAAQKEVRESPYSAGFQDGWDGWVLAMKPDDPEYALGYADGLAAAKNYKWRGHRSCDVSYR